MTISCAYRVHPGWFSGELDRPIKELASRAAGQMGRCVLRIEQLDDGYDKGGHFIDFRVVYGSTAAPSWEEVQHGQ